MQYRKTAMIEATQWHKNGDHPLDYAGEFEGFENDQFRTWTGDEARAQDWEGKIVRRYRLPDVSGETICKVCGARMHDHGWIDTLEGGHIVCPGDWIATGVQGEHWPIKPDVFAATYEAATPPPASADALGEVAEDLAREIADLFEEASNNPCTCNIDENSCRHCSAWVRAAHTTKERLTAALSAMSPAGDVERIAAWLRADADLTEVEAVKIVKNSMGNPRQNAAEWAMLVRVKRGLADAIERGDYRHD